MDYLRVVKNGRQKHIGVGNRIKWIVLHCIAKAYVVENYGVGITLRRKFNARLFGICLKPIFMGKYGDARAQPAMVVDRLKGC